MRKITVISAKVACLTALMLTSLIVAFEIIDSYIPVILAQDDISLVGLVLLSAVPGTCLLVAWVGGTMLVHRIFDQHANNQQ